jgi:endonuclease-3
VKNKRLATLVSLILSPQTKDEVCDAAVRKLRAALGGAISLEALLAAEEETIQEAIRKVGFWPKKTRYAQSYFGDMPLLTPMLSFLKESAEMLRDQFDGDVPRTIKELVELPGVGPKVGFLTLQFAWNMCVRRPLLMPYEPHDTDSNTGIGVDVHVHRITNLLGWQATSEPEQTRYIPSSPRLEHF